VDAFEAGFGQFKDHAYDEAKVRQGFVDPFFEALGWDVEGSARRLGRDREVVVEDRDGTGRKPDYGFYSGKRLKFFVEVKKPAVHLASNREAIYQAKEYAWNARAPLCLLTDFEELRVYSGGERPDREKPEHGLVLSACFHYRDYVGRFDELWSTFSFEAVQAGSIERLLFQHFGRRTGDPFRQGQPVDRVFLFELERWRERLASELARSNSDLTSSRLTEAVQRILDRIVFVRVCEARGIARGEPMRKAWELWRKRGGTLFHYLSEAFRQLDSLFNGSLFKRHWSEKLTLEKDEVLNEILTLLYADGPYRFDLLPVEILGSIYEQFLGSTIRVSGNDVKVEQRPEIAHAGGVYYTPRYIVDAIIEKTLAPLTKDKSPSELMRLRVLDPACGSGSFLLGAFQHLIEAHLDFYAKAPVPKGSKHVFFVDGAPRLTLHRKREILLNCIYGLDKDQQAVEVAEMSLYLKLLEGESEQSLARRETMEMFAADKYLPDLHNNVLAGNALVSSQHVDPAALGAVEESTLLAVNPFDWDSTVQGFGSVAEVGGFDAIIGNPPYIRIQELQKWAALEVRLFREHYESGKKGNIDIYILFLERCLRQLKKSGRLGFILPHKFFQATYGAKIRQIIAERRALNEVVDFGDAQVFENATTYTCLLFLTAAPNAHFTLRPVQAAGVDLPTALDHALAARVEPTPVSALKEKQWHFRAGGGALAKRLLSLRPPLGDVTSRIFQGLISGADDVFFLERRDDKIWSHALKSFVELEKELLHPLLKGSRHIRRYECAESPLVALFPYESGQLIGQAALAERFPAAWRYLNSCKTLLRERERGKWREVVNWHAYGRSQALNLVSLPKLLTPSIANDGSFVVDDEGAYFLPGSGGGGGGGYGILLHPDSDLSLHYLCALLNSRPLSWLLIANSTPFSGGYFAFNKQYIEQLPILTAGQPDRDALEELSRRCHSLQKQVRRATSDSEARLRGRQLAAAQAEIDDRVCSLYKLDAAARQQVQRTTDLHAALTQTLEGA
jgi:type I restriction-modification system DNA methylase subunit